MNTFIFSLCKKRKQANKADDDYIPTSLEMWQFYFKFFKIKWTYIVFLNAYSIINSLIYQRSPFIILEIQTAIEAHNQDQIISLIVEFLSYELIVMLFGYITNTLSGKMYGSLNATVQKQIMEHLFNLDVNYFEDHKVSNIQKVVLFGSSNICQQIQYANITSQINSFLVSFGSIYFIYKQSQSLMVTMVLFCLGFSLVELLLAKKIQKIQKEKTVGEEYKTFALDDILNNIQIIKAFGSEKKELKQMERIIQNNEKIRQKMNQQLKAKSMLQTSNNQILKIIVILQVSFGFLSKDSVSLSKSFGQIIAHIFQVIYACSTIIQAIFDPQQDYFEDGKKSIGKVMKLLQEKSIFNEQQGQNGKDDQVVEHLKGKINFEEVSFKYPMSKDALAKHHQKVTRERREQTKSSCQGINTALIEESSISSLEKVKSELTGSQTNGDEKGLQCDDISPLSLQGLNANEREYVISKLSFEIKQGECVAFVGMSGSGKSTIVKLLERFYDVNEGTVLFDDKNIKDLNVNQLRRSIGLVQQEPSLFDNDIEYNITYGCLDENYTQEELKNICNASGVSEFVFDEKRFPDGLKTLVGSKGMKLSGGQKQRIAIARALMKKPSILILDEATSSLDAESEHIVQTYIDNLMGHRGLTIIVIAHRLSTVINSDRIFVMKDGAIQEQGTHKQLLDQNGVYKQLIHHQINRNDELLNETNQSTISS